MLDKDTTKLQPNINYVACRDVNPLIKSNPKTVTKLYFPGHAGRSYLTLLRVTFSVELAVKLNLQG